jgi:hypothetical protein
VLIASSALYRAACDGSPLHPHLFPQRNLKEAPFRPPVRGFFFSGLIAGCGEPMESPHTIATAYHLLLRGLPRGVESMLIPCRSPVPSVSRLAQHARYRLRGIRVAKLIEKATSG